jgi:hypothetical protein
MTSLFDPEVRGRNGGVANSGDRNRRNRQLRNGSVASACVS